MFSSVPKSSIVDIVAPASSGRLADYELACKEIVSWGLAPRSYINFDMKHPYHSDEDQVRLSDLKRAIYDEESEVVWCLRGGYGTARLIPEMMKWKKPKKKKIFIGYSDITSLHLFFNQVWKWPTIHGPMISSFAKSVDHDSRNLSELKRILLTEKKQQKFVIHPLNKTANEFNSALTGVVSGGNLAVVATSIGTPIQIQTRGKILFLEDVGERGYQIDRMLNHLQMAGLFKGARAVVFGEFNNGKEPSGQDFSNFALERFAHQTSIPVFKTEEFGHGACNRPICSGVKSQITRVKGRSSQWLIG